MLLCSLVTALHTAVDYKIRNPDQLMTFMAAMDAYTKGKKYSPVRLGEYFDVGDRKFQVSRQCLTDKGLFAYSLPTDKAKVLYWKLEAEGFTLEKAMGLYRISNKLSNKYLLDIAFFAVLCDFYNGNSAAFSSMRQYYLTFYGEEQWRTRTKERQHIAERDEKYFDRTDLHPGSDFYLMPHGKSFATLLLHRVCIDDPKKKLYKLGDVHASHRDLVKPKRRRTYRL